MTSINRYLRERTSGPNVDIRTDPRFDIVKRVLKTRQETSARAGARPGINASDEVPREVLRKLFKDGHLGRSGPRPLARAVNFVLTTQFGCRSREVRYHIQTKGDLEGDFFNSLELDTEGLVFKMFTLLHFGISSLCFSGM